jgi:hypothetical protein
MLIKSKQKFYKRSKRSWFFEGISKIDKLLAILTKKKEGSQIHKIRDEKANNTTDTTDIQKIIRNYKQLHAKKLENLEEIDKFPNTYNLTKLNQEETENLNTPIIHNETEAVVKIFPSK